MKGKIKIEFLKNNESGIERIFGTRKGCILQLNVVWYRV